MSKRGDFRRGSRAETNAEKFGQGRELALSANQNTAARNKEPPFVKQPTEDITRAEAQRRAYLIFGPRAFARKHTKTSPGKRFEIGMRSKVGGKVVEVLGAGNSWREATKASIDAWEKRGPA